MTAEEFLKEKLALPHAYFSGEKFYTKEKVYDLSEVIEEYHQHKLKLLGIANVVGRSEQLKCQCNNDKVS